MEQWSGLLRLDSLLKHNTAWLSLNGLEKTQSTSSLKYLLPCLILLLEK